MSLTKNLIWCLIYELPTFFLHQVFTNDIMEDATNFAQSAEMIKKKHQRTLHLISKCFTKPLFRETYLIIYCYIYDRNRKINVKDSKFCKWNRGAEAIREEFTLKYIVFQWLSKKPSSWFNKGDNIKVIKPVPLWSSHEPPNCFSSLPTTFRYLRQQQPKRRLFRKLKPTRYI